MLKACVFILFLSITSSIFAETEVFDLDFNNAPVRAIIQSVATLMGKNVVIANNVTETMTVHFKKMPPLEALNLVLSSQNLTRRSVGETWYIGKTSDFAVQSKAEIDVLNQEDLLVPLSTDFLSIHYADGKALQAILVEDRSLLSARGQVVVDPRTNVLIVTDTPAHLKNIKNVVAHLDISVLQVHVDAKIVEVDKSALEALGVVLETGSRTAMTDLGAVGHTGIQVPIENPAGTLSLGVKHFVAGELDLELQALEKSGNGKVVSAPALTVSDNQEASIEQGSEVPYQTSTASGATQIEFKKAVLGLKVTPHLAKDGKITLLLQVNKDSISENVSPSGNIPIVNTSQVITTVLVESGETIILGGIYSEEHRHATSGVPVLSGIPAVGWLFRNHNDSDRYTDLLIFVTPTIVKN